MSTQGRGTDAKPPNPGSAEAVAIGCKCPVIDNHHGAGLPGNSGPVFYYNLRCPVHCKTGALAEEQGRG